MGRKLAMATRDKQVPLTAICYLAGVIDSDGCISISKMRAGRQRTANPRYVLTVNVVNTSESLMVWLVKKFGGRYKVRRKANDLHKTTYDWWYNNGKAIWLLDLIEPFLIVKNRQAKLGIRFIRNWKTNFGRGERLDDNEVQRRESCYLHMKELNRTGTVQLQRLNPLAPAARRMMR